MCLALRILIRHSATRNRAGALPLSMAFCYKSGIRTVVVHFRLPRRQNQVEVLWPDSV